MYKIFLKVLLAFFVLVLILWIFVQTSFFQNLIVRNFSKRLSRDLHTTVSIGHVDFELFDKVLLQQTLVLDHHHDTLLFAGAVKVSLTDWFFFKDSVTVHYLGLNDAVFHVNRKDSVWNYQFLVDYFSGPGNQDTTRTGTAIRLEKVELHNCKFYQQDQWQGTDIFLSFNNFSFQADTFDLTQHRVRIRSLAIDHPVFGQYDYTGNEPADTTTTSVASVQADTSLHKKTLEWNTDGWHMVVDRITITDGDLAVDKQTDRPVYSTMFDDQHIFISAVSGTLRHLQFLDDTLSATVQLTGHERSGLALKNLTADVRFTPHLMEFNRLDLTTNRSHLANYYSMRYNDFNADMQDFIHSVTLEGKFINSGVNSDDLAFFVPEAAAWKENFILSGNAKGTIDNLSARKMIIKAGTNNFLDGDIDLRGLPDMDQTFIDFRSRALRTNYRELARLIPSLATITNPNLASLGNIQFIGSYTGFIRDFVTYGTLTTDIGVLQTDIQMKLPPTGKPTYGGVVSTANFQLGQFIMNRQIGSIAFNGKINGTGFDAKDIDLGIDGNVKRLEFNGYGYSNITAHGRFKKDLFSGTAGIDDPNIRVDTLVGSINFSKLHPEFDLKASVGRLNLKNLGFTNDSISLTGNFDLAFAGNNIDNFLGYAKIYNAILLDNDHHLSFDSLAINSSIDSGKKYLSLETNELAASLTGNFKIQELPDAFQLFLNKYYPAYIDKPKQKSENQEFSFQVKTKNVSDYVALFNKKISGLDNSIFSGDINIAANALHIEAEIPQFNFSNVSFNNIHFTGHGTADTLSFNGDIDDVIINDSLHAPGTKIQILAHNDLSDVTINTSANKTLNAANLSASVQTNSNGFQLIFNPSTFTINEKAWTISRGGQLQLYKNKLLANGIKFVHDGQEISVSTQPSSTDSSNDILVGIKTIEVGDFAPLFFKTPKVNGLLSGSILVMDPFGDFAVTFHTQTEQFLFENDSIGVIAASGSYLSQDKDVAVHVVSDNHLYNFLADFAYHSLDTTSNQLSGTITLNHSEIHVLENYLSDIFSNISGRATGDLHISGTTADTKLTGKVSLDSTSLTVDYTRCRYTLDNNTVLTFNPDEIDLGTIKIRDTLHNSATVTGKLYHSFFDNFFFNELHLKTDPRGKGAARFVLLNTTARDNTDFYGNIVGDAEMSLNGFVTDMKLDITGEPTDSSHIYLPTGETAETGSLDYIEFAKLGHQMKSDLSSHENSNIKVNMVITANPYAKIDVILDETTGDVIRAQGSGKLSITAGTQDPLTIRGRYDIEEGEYTFNFQTFLKTPFTLQRGSIEWQGDPYLANLDIDAIYKAANVDLSNIPTSTGKLATTKGDVDIIFKLRGTLKTPEPSFEFQFPFDNPLKSDPIAIEYLKTFQNDQDELNRQVTSLLLFNTFISSQQGLITSNSTGNFVTRTVGQLLSSTLTSSLNSWLKKLLNTNSVNLYTNINTADFNFEKGAVTQEVQNVGNFGVKSKFLNNRLLVSVGGNVDYRLVQATANANSNFLFSPDVSFEYLISPDGRLRVIGFNRTDADIGDISGLTRRNRTGVQLSYRKEFGSFSEFFTEQKKKTPKKPPARSDTTSRK